MDDAGKIKAVKDSGVEKKVKKKASGSSKPQNDSKKDKKRKKKGNDVWYTIKSGQSMSLTFFKRNGWLILLVVVAVIWLISQRYSNKSRMEEIKALEKELRLSESKMLDAKAEYMSLIRESRMKELMESNNLRISYQEQPPYILPSN